MRLVAPWVLSTAPSGETIWKTHGNSIGLDTSNHCAGEDYISGYGTIQNKIGRVETGWHYDFDTLACYRINGRGVRCWQGMFAATSPTLPTTIRLVENPVSDQITLSEAAKEMTLRDAQGRLVARASTSYSLPVTTLTPGIYVLQVTNLQGRQATLRVVKN